MAIVSMESNLESIFMSMQGSGIGGGITTVPVEQSTFRVYNSRLYQLHVEGRDLVPTVFGNYYDNSGFTRPYLPLSEYYTQLRDDNGTFGIRNDNLKADNQPYVIRGIGERWGVKNVQIPDNIPLKSKLSLAVRDQFGWVANRDVSTFKDRYNADVARLSKFGNPNSLYTKNQVILQGRNPQTSITSIKYGLTTVDSGNSLIDTIVSKTPYGDYFSLSPQVYNPDSVYSVPGVSGMMFNRMAMAGTDVFNISDQVDDAIGIISNISRRALDLAAPKVAQKVTHKIGEWVDDTKDYSIDVVDYQLVNLSSAKTLREHLDTKIGKGENPQSLMERADGIKKKLKKADAFRKEAGLLFAPEKAAAGKAKLINLDPAAFEDIDVDRVNLIKYGSDKDKKTGKSYDKLDWIPFKFYDTVGKKHIVFRALLSGITDTFSPEYSSERYVGRPDAVHVYQGTNREISFNFDVYPKSDTELIVLWHKLNYLAGLTYPHWTAPDATGGQGMISPYSKLTIGDMYKDTPGYISSLTYTVQDNGTWEVDFAKLPKYIQVACTFVFIGNRFLESGINGKHYDIPSIKDVTYQTKGGSAFVDKVANALVEGAFNKDVTIGDTMKEAFPDILGAAGK